ncbi:MAG: hypothetical protein ACUVQY_07305 [Thermoproteota archaeon]
MPELALKGGIPVVPGGLRVDWPIFGDEEKNALIEVLESGKWRRGAYEDPSESKVGKFEVEFCKY